MLHGMSFREGVGARNSVVFRVRWPKAVMKGSSFVRPLPAVRFDLFDVPLCMSWWLQGALGVFVCA